MGWVKQPRVPNDRLPNLDRRSSARPPPPTHTHTSAPRRDKQHAGPIAYAVQGRKIQVNVKGTKTEPPFLMAYTDPKACRGPPGGGGGPVKGVPGKMGVFGTERWGRIGGKGGGAHIPTTPRPPAGEPPPLTRTAPPPHTGQADLDVSDLIDRDGIIESGISRVRGLHLAMNAISDFY